MFYTQFEDEHNNQQKPIQIQDFLTIRTAKGEWKAKFIQLTSETLDIVNRKFRSFEKELTIKLTNIESIQYPALHENGEVQFEIPNVKNYPSLFAIYHACPITGQLNKLYAYATSVEKCRTWVSYLAAVKKNQRNQSDNEDLKGINSYYELASLQKPSNDAKIWDKKLNQWVQRSVSIGDCLLSIKSNSGKLQESIPLTHVIEIGSTSGIMGSKSLPSYVKENKGVCLKVQTSLLKVKTLTMYFDKEETSLEWKGTLKDFVAKVQIISNTAIA